MMYVDIGSLHIKVRGFKDVIYDVEKKYKAIWVHFMDCCRVDPETGRIDSGMEYRLTDGNFGFLPALSDGYPRNDLFVKLFEIGTFSFWSHAGWRDFYGNRRALYGIMKRFVNKEDLARMGLSEFPIINDFLRDGMYHDSESDLKDYVDRFIPHEELARRYCHHAEITDKCFLPFCRDSVMDHYIEKVKVICKPASIIAESVYKVICDFYSQDFSKFRSIEIMFFCDTKKEEEVFLCLLKKIHKGRISDFFCNVDLTDFFINLKNVSIGVMSDDFESKGREEDEIIVAINHFSSINENTFFMSSASVKKGELKENFNKYLQERSSS